MAVALEKQIFLGALDHPSPEERTAYLDQVCGADVHLRRAVDRLLTVHDRPDNLLDQMPAPVPVVREQLEAAAGIAPDATLQHHQQQPPVGPLTPDRTGEVIGAYRLMEKIGEGGFGQVYVAEQQRPVRRRVALKLLKAGMDSREVINRFMAERQALAMMSHPHIAQVLDAGATSMGQPFFVMELVRGVPLTQFCDERRLSTDERLELFVDVCQAVQHAHQKGIIHRDLKPSNVIVTLHDGVPVVKVIDFGVAKAIREPLTDQTLYTRFAQMIGTPLYMSPEQAEMSGLDVDTRSDIYSLGVMLYELLTGTTPFDQRRLQTAGLDELRRIIREEEPPRPSVRLSTLAESLPTVVESHRTERRALTNLLRGDLDWIVMKSLEKDRRRRYETAADFARDVQRYLHQEPVVARPPSPWYRFSKFARRNKVALSTAALVLAALVAGTAVSTWQAVLATHARAEADALRQDAVDFAQRLKDANVLIDSAQANAAEQRWSLALQQYTQATDLQPDHYLVWSGRGSLLLRLGLWTRAEEDYANALRLGAPANNPGWWGVPQLCLFAGDDTAYQQICHAISRQLERSTDPDFALFAIRSFATGPFLEADLVALADRAEQLLTQDASSGFRHRGSDAPNFRPPSFQPPPPGRGGGSGPPGRAPQRFPPMLPAGLKHYTSGLAHYRAGHAESAILQLQHSLDAETRWPAAPIAYPVLALAYQQAGQAEAAGQALAEAQDALDRWTSTLEEASPEALPIPWFDYIECLVLYREAHQAIHGSPAPDQPRLQNREARVYAALLTE